MSRSGFFSVDRLKAFRDNWGTIKKISDNFKEQIVIKRTPLFTDEDFAGLSAEQRFFAAQRANAKLDKLIAEMTVVYGDNHQIWGKLKEDGDIHTARLFDVRKIEKNVCEHTFPNRIYEYPISPNGNGISHITAECKCGVKLKAKWEVCE